MSTISVRLDDDTLTRLNNLSKQTGRPKSYYFREMIERTLDDLEYEYDVKKSLEDYRAGKMEFISLEEAKRYCGF